MNKKKARYHIPHYCKIIVEGRTDEQQPWGLVNAFKDDNALVFTGEMENAKLLDKANLFADNWRRTYPTIGQTRVVQL